MQIDDFFNYREIKFIGFTITLAKQNSVFEAVSKLLIWVLLEPYTSWKKSIEKTKRKQKPETPFCRYRLLINVMPKAKKTNKK